MIFSNKNVPKLARNEYGYVKETHSSGSQINYSSELNIEVDFSEYYKKNEVDTLINSVKTDLYLDIENLSSLDASVKDQQNTLDNLSYLDASVKDHQNTLDNLEEIINSMSTDHVLLTESEYNNLPEKDEKTVYMIKGSHFILLTNEEYTNLRQKDESKIYLITT